MTVPETMANVLDKIRRDFYADKVREFQRDQRSLMRAIATYGHECNQRNWNFEADFIYQQLMNLLMDIRVKGADIKFFPIYLEGAIRKSLGQQAEELSAKAKAIVPKINTIINSLKPVEAIRQPTAVEIFSQVFTGIKKINRQRKREATGVAATKQKELL